MNILGQVCDALTVAHDGGVIHRDLKPENIFLLDRAGAPDFVKVFDFGIAKVTGEREDEKLTKDQAIFGTPHYMSPEQAEGEAPDLRSDLYALGLILYEMLAGDHPFDSDDPMEVLRRQMLDTPPPLSASCPDFVLPPELDDVFAAFTAKDRNDRPSSAGEAKELLLAVFDDISGGDYGLARRPTQEIVTPEVELDLEALPPAPRQDGQGRYMDVVMHEMRSPLTVVSSGVEMLAAGTLGELNPRQARFLRMIRRNIDRMSRFSTNVLSLSRLDSGRHGLTPREVALGPVLEAIASRLQPEAGERGVTVEIQGEPADLKVVADPEALSQILSNLLSNVLLSSSGARRVTIEFGARDDHLVEVQLSDDGPGLPAGDLKGAFDRFYGADAGGEILSGFRGIGIRLSVCRALVESMAGRMSARACPDGGTVFHFTLPRPAAVREFLFGRVALQGGHIKPAALEQAVTAQWSAGEDPPRLGQLMVQQGDLTHEELQAVLRVQRGRLARPHTHLPVSLRDGLFGRMARKYDYVTDAQVNRCVCIQATGEGALRLGQVLVLQGHMTAGEVLKVLRMQQVSIASCARCSRRYNVVRLAASEQGPRCPRCGEDLVTLAAPGEVEVDGDVE